MKRRQILVLLGLAAGTGGLAIACDANQSAESPGSSTELVVYSGRDKKLVGEIIKQFEQETGAKVQVRYGDTAELAAAILEEGTNSPADVFFAQDAGALGALQKTGRSSQLPEQLLSKVDASYRSNAGQWVGVTGRVRTVD